ncbi:hypothetical protein GW17_00000517 [Ensete ventricosum]|nr:hypothetical protein GW17_00000517 [Ensete ventricosum]RZS07522.1 hypothetical protein BHM03_00038371 [Ensete ventricosum]
MEFNFTILQTVLRGLCQDLDIPFQTSMLKSFPMKIKEAVFKTLISNGMFDNAHIRLTLTRGEKKIVSLGNAVLAEWKPPVYDNSGGIKLVTATTRRNSPNVR